MEGSVNFLVAVLILYQCAEILLTVCHVILLNFLGKWSYHLKIIFFSFILLLFILHSSFSSLKAVTNLQKHVEQDRHPHTLSRQKGDIFKHSLDVMELRKCNFLPIYWGFFFLMMKICRILSMLFLVVAR